MRPLGLYPLSRVVRMPNVNCIGPWRVETIYKICLVKDWLFPVLLLRAAKFDLFLPGTNEWHLPVDCRNCVTIIVFTLSGPLYPVPIFMEIIDSANQQLGKYPAVTDWVGSVPFTAYLNSLTAAVAFILKGHDTPFLGYPHGSSTVLPSHMVTEGKDLNCILVSPRTQVSHYINNLLLWGHAREANIEKRS